MFVGLRFSNLERSLWNDDPCQQWDFVFLKKRGGPPYLSAVRFWTLQNLMRILKLWHKMIHNVDANGAKLWGMSGQDVPQFCTIAQMMLRNYLWRCQTLWFISWTPNRSWIWLIYGGYLWFWSSLEVQKLAVPLFWCSSNLKSNVTWRTPERRLSLSIQTTFFGPKRVYILGRF